MLSNSLGECNELYLNTCKGERGVGRVLLGHCICDKYLAHLLLALGQQFNKELVLTRE